MTPVRFSIALLAASLVLAMPARAQRAAIAPAEYQARRAALATAIGPDAALIAFSSEPARRTGDVDWPFRQEDNLLYLTGLNDRRRRWCPYEAGMVFTNEPGVYVRKDDIFASEIVKQLPAPEQASMRAAVMRYDGIGVRIEDDVLITAGEPKILSAGAPRTVKDIEAWMAAKR